MRTLLPGFQQTVEAVIVDHRGEAVLLVAVLAQEALDGRQHLHALVGMLFPLGRADLEVERHVLEKDAGIATAAVEPGRGHRQTPRLSRARPWKRSPPST